MANYLFKRNYSNPVTSGTPLRLNLRNYLMCNLNHIEPTEIEAKNLLVIAGAFPLIPTQ